MDQATQERNVLAAVQSIAGLAETHQLVVTHGNGPQVGLLALSQDASGSASPYTLDVLGSETQGMIGYLLEEALRARLPGKDVATLLTQVLVDGTDPAFSNPTKPIGPTYSAAEAQKVTSERGWVMARDGDGYRRVVASPEPRRILELSAIRLLTSHDVLVICAGGGGVPVVRGPDGACYGVEAVVDKDLTAALLARELDADMLMLLTDVDAVEIDWRTPRARKIRTASPGAMRSHRFAAGSMGPKVEAACRFVEATGRRAAIGSLEQAVAISLGGAGTSIVRSSHNEISFWD
jgi:carbamate kinase